MIIQIMIIISSSNKTRKINNNDINDNNNNSKITNNSHTNNIMTNDRRRPAARRPARPLRRGCRGDQRGPLAARAPHGRAAGGAAAAAGGGPGVPWFEAVEV